MERIRSWGRRLWRAVSNIFTVKELAEMLVDRASWVAFVVTFFVAAWKFFDSYPADRLFLYALTASVLGSLLILLVRLNRKVRADDGAKPVPPAVASTAIEPYPNWTIKELFLHLDPNAMDGDWEEIGRTILNELSAGVRLKAWGLRYAGSQESTERESREIPIPRKHWDGADFTYFFFADDHRFVPHTSAPAYSSIPKYADVRVSKEQALSIWPSAIRTSEPDRQISFVEFASIAAVRFGWKFAPGNFAYYEFMKGVRHGCNDGDLYMKGKAGCDLVSDAGRDIPLLEPIHAKEWREKDLRIWSYSGLDTALPDADNWDIRISSVKSNREVYRDPYITSRKTAVSWLERIGPEWKGRKEARYLSGEERRATQRNGNGISPDKLEPEQ